MNQGVRPNKLWHWFAVAFLLATFLAEGHIVTSADIARVALEIRAEIGDGFPDSFTAMKKGKAVHGRYREPCPDCGKPVQRIVYVEKNECNYCAVCQNAGRMLADRALSQLMRKDWPKTLEELEQRRRGGADSN